ncbi:MAG: hypothetical protein H0U87_04815 [Acidobacteria bacterium]|nr:hypothetical protein [Acidobacteriota bacterium]
MNFISREDSSDAAEFLVPLSAEEYVSDLIFIRFGADIRVFLFAWAISTNFR